MVLGFRGLGFWGLGFRGALTSHLGLKVALNPNYTYAAADVWLDAP